MTEIQTSTTADDCLWRGEWHDPDLETPSAGKAKKGEFGRFDKKAGWKVVYWHDGASWAIPLVFGRKQDADAAAKAIASLCDWPTHPEDIVARMNSIGLGKIRQVMLEAMAW